MAKDLNQCQFIGRLARDIETRFMQDGKAVANGTLAVSGYKDQTEWVKFSAFDKLAELLAKYLSKGSQIYLSGRMQTRKWQDKNGETRYSTEIIAQEVQFLGSNEPRQPQTGGYPEPPMPDRQEPDSDVPF